MLASHDPVGRDPVLACGKYSYGSQQLLISYVNILVDNGGIKIVSVEFLYAS